MKKMIASSSGQAVQVPFFPICKAGYLGQSAMTDEQYVIMRDLVAMIAKSRQNGPLDTFRASPKCTDDYDEKSAYVEEWNVNVDFALKSVIDIYGHEFLDRVLETQELFNPSNRDLAHPAMPFSRFQFLTILKKSHSQELASDQLLQVSVANFDRCQVRYQTIGDRVISSLDKDQFDDISDHINQLRDVDDQYLQLIKFAEMINPSLLEAAEEGSVAHDFQRLYALHELEHRSRFKKNVLNRDKFIRHDVIENAGRTVLWLLGVPILETVKEERGGAIEVLCVKQQVEAAISSSGEFISTESRGGGGVGGTIPILVFKPEMAWLLAMFKNASSQCSDRGAAIREVIRGSKLGESVRSGLEEKDFGDAFSRRIFREFNEFLSAGTHSHDVAESERDSESVHIDGVSRELGYRLLDDPASHSVESGSSNSGSRVPSLDGSDGEERAQELNMVSSASSGSLNSSSISTDNANLTSAPGSSDWWRNLNERIQRLCEKLKEIDSRTHFLAPFLKHESSAVPRNPVLAEAPLRKIRTSVPLKNNGENSGNKNVHSFNNRPRFSTGFFSRLFPRIRV